MLKSIVKMDKLNMKDRKGSTMITATLSMVVFILLVTAYISRISNEYILSGRSHVSAEAFCLAEAGVEYAIWELNFVKTWGAGHGWSAWNPTGSENGYQKTVNSFITQGGVLIGAYRVNVTDPTQGLVIIESTGYVPTITSPQATRRVRVRVRSSLFHGGIFSKGDLDLKNDFFSDSFDSTGGLSYAAYTALNAAGNEGDVGSNGEITITSGTVNGDVTPGPGETFGGGATVTGSTSPAGATVILPDVTVPGGLLNIGSITDNTTYTIGPGNVETYLCTGISLMGNKQLTVTGGGQLILYVTGDIDVGGNGFANTSGVPTNLVIYGTSTCEHIKFNGNPDVAAAIYAPNAEATIVGASATLYGAMTVKGYTGNNHVTVHRDLACDNLTPSFAQHAIFSWQEK